MRSEGEGRAEARPPTSPRQLRFLQAKLLAGKGVAIFAYMVNTEAYSQTGEKFWFEVVKPADFPEPYQPVPSPPQIERRGPRFLVILTSPDEWNDWLAELINGIENRHTGFVQSSGRKQRGAVQNSKDDMVREARWFRSCFMRIPRKKP